MSVTAKQLSQSGVRRKDIDTIVREQLQIIDDRLLRSERSWGRNVATVEVPSNFNIPGLKRQDGQRLVYSTIIRSLAGRGFDVGIQMDKDRTTLYIAWDASLNQEEIDAMNKLISDHRLMAEDVASFRLPRADKARPSAGSQARDAHLPGALPAVPASVIYHAQVREPPRRGEEEPRGGAPPPSAAEKEILEAA